MTRGLGRWLGCGVVLVLLAAATFWAFQRYVGTEASHDLAVGVFPCPFHAGQARWDSRTAGDPAGP